MDMGVSGSNNKQVRRDYKNAIEDRKEASKVRGEKIIKHCCAWLLGSIGMGIGVRYGLPLGGVVYGLTGQANDTGDILLNGMWGCIVGTIGGAAIGGGIFSYPGYKLGSLVCVLF